MFLNRVKKPKKVVNKKLMILRGLKPAKEKYGKAEQIGYWRKANHIHAWFVDNCGDGEDSCQQIKVSKEQLQLLLEAVNNVLKNKELAEQLLPTQEGFFFGDTDYDSWYYDSLKDTKKIITEAINETDWDSEEVIYQASW